jgi:hypothetical protein
MQFFFIIQKRYAERPWRHSRAERGNDQTVSIYETLVGCQAAIVGTPPGPSSLPQEIGVRLSLLTTQQAER